MGTRVSVMVLLGVVLFAIATERGSDVRMLAMAAVGLGGGYLVTAHLRMSSILRPPRANRAEAIRLAIFLSVGVALSIGLAMAINLPHAYWIVILFVSRCLMPMQDRSGALLKYGHGAALGVAGAILIELVGTPDTWRLLLALAAFGLGLRFLPHPKPISAAAMTAGVLLVSAPTPTEATFRIEAVFLVIALILFLTLMLESCQGLWAHRPPSPQARTDKPVQKREVPASLEISRDALHLRLQRLGASNGRSATGPQCKTISAERQQRAENGTLECSRPTRHPECLNIVRALPPTVTLNEEAPHLAGLSFV
ncbi:MAG: hypothetical protein V4630_17465 [Pseudomonadota bacterium]